VGLVAAGLSGLLLAWGLRWLSQVWNAPRSSGTPLNQVLRASAAVPPAFAIAGRAGTFATLADAVAACADGDVLVLHGNGPVPTAPISWRGKALTLRAAPGGRPRLVMSQPPGHPWQALLATDRDLTLEGLDLSGPEGVQAEGHLLACERSSLRLTDCRLLAASTSAAVVVRNGAELTLRGCHIDAGPLALSVEVGQADPCKIRLENSTIITELHSGVALALWAAEARQATAIDLHLERNNLSAGRVLVLRSPHSRLTVRAANNDFSFHEALLSYAGTGKADGWRRSTTWQERDNHYHAAGPWLLVEGRPLAVRDIAAWARLWEASNYEIPDSRDNTK
jgi:hypothetical protein